MSSNGNDTGLLRNSVYDQLVKYCPEEQNAISDEDAENAINYGIKCLELKEESYYNVVICLSPMSNEQIYLINQDKEDVLKININNIANITYKNIYEKYKNYTNLNSYSFCEILVDRKSYDFCFKNKIP